MLCPCDTGKQYTLCCEPYHKGAPAPTALCLMRSRFSAFKLRNADYLMQTLHSDFHGEDEREALSASLAQTDWRQLHIHSANDVNSSEATVEFSAYYQDGPSLSGIRELSRFKKIDDQWLYCDGDLSEAALCNEPKRNEPCWCTSGKKYKRCHGGN